MKIPAAVAVNAAAAVIAANAVHRPKRLFYAAAWVLAAQPARKAPQAKQDLRARPAQKALLDRQVLREPLAQRDRQVPPARQA